MNKKVVFTLLKSLKRPQQQQQQQQLGKGKM